MLRLTGIILWKLFYTITRCYKRKLFYELIDYGMIFVLVFFFSNEVFSFTMFMLFNESYYIFYLYHFCNETLVFFSLKVIKKSISNKFLVPYFLQSKYIL